MIKQITYLNEEVNAPMKCCDEIIIHYLYFILHFSTIGSSQKISQDY